MIRLTRLTDYGIVLMAYFASRPDEQHSAAEAAEGARLPLPTVSKLLRSLSREGLLVSHRGVKGGYSLAEKPSTISVAAIIEALEGPIALTACFEEGPGLCEQEDVCAVRAPWQKINHAIRGALEDVKLSDMAGSLPLHVGIPVARNGASAGR